MLFMGQEIQNMRLWKTLIHVLLVGKQKLGENPRPQEKTHNLLLRLAK